MFRKGIALVVMLLFVGVSIVPSLGNVVEDSGISLITIKVIGNREENGWYLGDVPIIITSESDEIAEIYYSIGGGSWTEYTEPFNISVDGDDIPLGWYAVDFEGNQSEVDGPYLFDIDQTVPDIEEVVWEAFEDPPYSGHWYVTFTCDATDATSGMDRVEMYIDDGFHEEVIGSGPIYTFTIEWSEAFEKHIYWFYHYDVAGNWVEDDMGGSIPPSGFESSLFSTGIAEEDSHQYNQNIVTTTEIVEREKTQSDCSISGDFDPSYIVIDVNRAKGDNDWIISDVKINMIPDPDDISAVYYKLDGGDWTLYTESFVISEDGIHSFSWYVIDLEGYSSTPDSMSFKIDQTPPKINLIKKRIAIGKIKFTADVYDETSNIDKVEFRRGKGNHLEFTDYDFPYEWIWKGLGNEKVNATVYDNAGNRNSSSVYTWHSHSRSSSQQSSTSNSETIGEKSESLETNKENDRELCVELIYTFYPTDDTYASHSNPDENYGSSEDIRITNEYGVNRNSGWADVAYVIFDLWDLHELFEKEITSAELSFYYHNYEGTDPVGRDLNLYRVTSDWDEDILTWNNQPTYEAEPNSSATVPSSVGKWIKWDVTSDIQSLIDNYEFYHDGYRISDDNYWGQPNIPTTMVKGKENESFRPYLEVVYSVSISSDTEQDMEILPVTMPKNKIYINEQLNEQLNQQIILKILERFTISSLQFPDSSHTKNFYNLKECSAGRKIAYAYCSYSPFYEGPLWFYLDDPGDITFLQDTASGAFLTGGTWANEERWIACEYYTGALWKIDPENGDMESIGGGGTGLHGLAYDPVNEKLYGASSNGSTGGLWLIDIETGEQEYVGDFGNNWMIGIAFDAEGILYGWDIQSDYLYTIDTETGEATEVGPLGIDLNYRQDGAFEFDDDILYLAAYANDSDSLYKCDEDTGECTLVGPLAVGGLTAVAIPWSYPYVRFNWTPTLPAPGETILFNASASYDPDGYITLYEWDWDNDGVFDENHTNSTATHSWFNTGNYPVTLRVTDNAGLNMTKTRKVLVDQPPTAPIITGPTNGRTWVEYDYNFSISDPDDDSMYLRVDWGNGTSGPWHGPFDSDTTVRLNYTWNQKGTYIIRAQAKDIYDVESEWGYLEVTMPKNQPAIHNTKFLQLFERFTNSFPLLEQLFNLQQMVKTTRTTNR